MYEDEWEYFIYHDDEENNYGLDYDDTYYYSDDDDYDFIYDMYYEEYEY
jgi:hypothetical protein